MDILFATQTSHRQRAANRFPWACAFRNSARYFGPTKGHNVKTLDWRSFSRLREVVQPQFNLQYFSLHVSALGFLSNVTMRPDELLGVRDKRFCLFHGQSLHGL
jgi:hypothetical protein